MWHLLKHLFQITFFLIWGLTLIYLIFLSCFTLVIFNICLSVFLFWFSLTLIGWSITLLPILKFVFIPYHYRQCHLWTKNKQSSRQSVAFFHPYCNNRSGNERVLWTTIESILKKYKHDIQIIIYTGDNQTTSEETLQSVKEYFNIDLNIYRSSIHFIYLRTRFLLEEKNYKILSLFGSNIGSIIVGFEALARFLPDIYIDSTGYAFTYPCFYYLASIPIISYVHHPIIRSHRLNRITEQYATTLTSKIVLIYYEIFTQIYGWCGSCSKITFCNSSWTKKQLESTYEIQLVYPPCDIKQLLDLPLMYKDEQEIKSIVSIGQFRSEKNHQLQIRIFHEFLQR
jgi:alpha-1,2-mannosyltransferase